jgi:hypothetical protein
VDGISFFAKPSFLNYKDRHLMRGSSIIRGEQVASYIGAKLNPETGYENDVCIYVKPGFKSPGHIKLPNHAYIDIVDVKNLDPFYSENPEIPIIACLQKDYEYLAHKLSNKIIFIPQHHCNFERVKRSRDQITTVGVIGFPDTFKWLPQNFEKRLTQNGLDLLAYSDFHNRQDVVNFYKMIDIQVIWRPWKQALQNPLKMVNAASFGIPTVAYDEDAFKEMEGCYFSVRTLDEFMDRVESLRNSSSLYSAFSQNCIDKAEDYHISNVGEIYKKLEAY